MFEYELFNEYVRCLEEQEVTKERNEEERRHKGGYRKLIEAFRNRLSPSLSADSVFK
jgi:hypothetical protein